LSTRPPQPGLSLITELEATLDEPLDLGTTPHGHRRVVPVTGGRLHGPRLTGEILPGGADWQIIHPGGWAVLEARYTARADSGELISVLSRGVRHGPPEVMARLLAGESPDASEYRFRTAITFETAEDSSHAWLNHIVAVASAIREPAAVVIDIYEVT
jgi:hypothetical protein